MSEKCYKALLEFEKSMDMTAKEYIDWQINNSSFLKHLRETNDLPQNSPDE